MNKHLITTAIRSDEAEALIVFPACYLALIAHRNSSRVNDVVEKIFSPAHHAVNKNKYQGQFGSPVRTNLVTGISRLRFNTGALLWHVCSNAG